MRNTTSENLCYSKTHEVESVKLTKSGVGVEKGIKAVISANFSLYGETNIQ